MLLRNHHVSGQEKLEEIILDSRLPAPIMIIRGGRQACQEHPILRNVRSLIHVILASLDIAKWSTLSLIGEFQVKPTTPKLTRMTRVVMPPLCNSTSCQSRSIENLHQELLQIRSRRSFRERVVTSPAPPSS